MTTQNYIKLKQEKNNNFNIRGTFVSVKDRNTSGIDPRSYVNKALKMVPARFLMGLENIYIGNFQYMKDREIQAFYKNKSIYLSSDLETQEEAIDNIIHEIAHHVETRYKDEIYSDGSIKKEFLEKRKSLWMKLKSKGIETNLEKFLNPSFDVEFDEFLYKVIGYPTLSLVTANLFYSPYGSTSLREYFANGFEAFFMREDVNLLKRISPILYGKIVMLLKEEEI